MNDQHAGAARPRRFMVLLLLLAPSLLFAAERAPSPGPDPPEFVFPPPEAPSSAPRRPLTEAPSVEWTLHRTDDLAHPDGHEQQMVWLMNRARSDPPAEGAWLASLEDPDVLEGIDYFEVDLEVLRDEFDLVTPMPPAAFDARLYNAAYEHSLYLIDCNCQSHLGQDTLVRESGFKATNCRGNVFSYARSATHAHGALNIDYGNSDDGTGMQPGRGHRVAIMSIDRSYYNVGIAFVPNDGSYPEAGPLVMTGNYCMAYTGGAWSLPEPDHYNRFFVGTVWADDNGNGLYDPGEGMGGVRVTPDKGTYYAVTPPSGGYAVPITEEGVHEITFSGGSLEGSVTRTRKAGSVSILLDVLEGWSPAGDLSGDGRIDLADVILAMKVLAGLGESLFIPAESDVDGDSRTGLAEAVFALQEAASPR